MREICIFVGVTMTLDEFKTSLAQAEPPPHLPPLLLALWQEAKGDWDAAHRLTQAINGGDGAWVHAYLHRKEGDISNASYWYACANRPVSHLPLIQEWEIIANALLHSAS